MRRYKGLSLRGSLLIFCILAGVLLWGSMLPLFVSQSHAIVDRQSQDVVRGRAKVASSQLTLALHGDWARLQSLVQAIQRGESAERLQLRFDTIKDGNVDTAWIGFADPSGKVVIASGKVLEGDSVLSRPWFRGGLEGPFAGDKHEALLLAKFVPAMSSEPLRLIDLAVPVRGADGTLLGVLGMHINWYWVRDFLRSFGRDDGIDIILASRERDILVGPADLEGSRPAIASLMAGAQGVQRTSTEMWPDGQRYLVTSLPIASYKELPSFGWCLLARQRADASLAPLHLFSSSVVPLLAAAGAVLLLGAALLANALAAPMNRLARVASEMAGGHFDTSVPDERRYREVAVLSAALARLQSAEMSEVHSVALPHTNMHGHAAE